MILPSRHSSTRRVPKRIPPEFIEPRCQIQKRRTTMCLIWCVISPSMPATLEKPSSTCQANQGHSVCQHLRLPPLVAVDGYGKIYKQRLIRLRKAVTLYPPPSREKTGPDISEVPPTKVCIKNVWFGYNTRVLDY